jgi:zinc protease
MVSYETLPEKIVPALQAILEELSGLVASPPVEDELTRARAISTKAFVEMQEDPSSLAGLIGTFELDKGDYRLKDAFLSVWSRITAADVADYASQLFRPENVTLTVLLPEAAPDLKETELSQIVQALETKKPSVSERAKEAFTPLALKSGAKLLVMRDGSIPLVEVKIGLLGGRLIEAPGKEGETLLMTEVWPKATTNRSSTELARAIDDLGASINGFANGGTFGLNATFLSTNWREGLSLLTELLTSPAFNDEDISIERDEILAYLKNLDEDLSYRSFRLVRKEIYRNHPFASDIYGTPESVAALKKEDLEELYGSYVHPENLVITVAGDVDPSQVVAFFDQALSSWKPSGEAKKVTVPELPPFLTKTAEASETLDRAQTHLAISFLAPKKGDPDQAALDVLNSVLSGMGGTLFMELRDKKSLAYAVGSFYSTSFATGNFGFYIGSAPEKTAEALKGILGIVDDSRQKPFPPDVVEGAKTYLSGVNKLQRQTLGSLASEALQLDLGGQAQDFNERYLERIALVTPEDVLVAAQKYLDIKSGAVAIVGKEDSIKAAEAILPK